jgi:hypothetical protein
MAAGGAETWQQTADRWHDTSTLRHTCATWIAGLDHRIEADHGQL